jgi:hypothetical protein
MAATAPISSGAGEDVKEMTGVRSFLETRPAVFRGC